MREVRLIYLRNGSFSWRLDEDMEKRNRFRMETMVASWSEHLLQHERMTRGELDAWERTWKLHTGDRRPSVKHYLSVNRELQPQRPIVRPVRKPPQGPRPREMTMVSADPKSVAEGSSEA